MVPGHKLEIMRKKAIKQIVITVFETKPNIIDFDLNVKVWPDEKIQAIEVLEVLTTGMQMVFENRSKPEKQKPKPSLKEIVCSIPNDYPGYTDDHIKELLKLFPDVNKEKFDAGLVGVTCMLIEGRSRYHLVDVLHALQSALGMPISDFD